MWFRLSEQNIIPGPEMVGLFRPDSVEGFDKENGKTAVVLTDGRIIASPFGLKVLTRRYKEGKI